VTSSKGDGLVVKIYFGEPETRPHGFQPGTIDTDGKRYLKVATSDGYINIKNIQLQGKKRMDIAEFLRGFPLAANSQFQ
jgi:methionyl-tRNA formyltransferase